MRLLITGGAGFIGSHIADRLLRRGDQVLVVDNYATGRRDNLAPNPSLEIVEGTIADAQLVAEVFARFKPETVIHAAAAYKNPDDWVEDARTNVLGTVHVARAARENAVKRLIYFQTALCYGNRPMEQPITLNHPIRPESSYAISKTAGELYIEQSGLDFLSFRLANAYGARNLSGPLPTFYIRLTTGKKCFAADTRRDFVYVDDLVDCVMKAIDGKGEKGHYHISSGSDVAIKDLFDVTVSALGMQLDGPVEVRPRGVDDAFSILLDPSKTKRDFDWAVRVPLTDGVQKTIEYYRSFGIAETYTHLRHEPAK